MSLAEQRGLSATEPTVLLVGNPNVGKTTLFNALTGASARVGNYPGVTVERREGSIRLGEQKDGPGRLTLVDVPGAYSLSARSFEEQLVLHAVLGMQQNPEPDLVCVVVDAGQLIRNLYLVIQLVELRVPLVIALNMVDEVADRPPRAEAISDLFGVPCVATNARQGFGLDALKRALERAVEDPPQGRVEIPYPPELRAEVDAVAECLPANWRRNVERDRALARWAVCSIESDDELVGIDEDLRKKVLEVHEESGRDLDLEIISARYAWLDDHGPGLYQATSNFRRRENWTERVDRFLLHPAFGFVFFVLVMVTIFQALFTWADPAISLIEGTFTGLQDLVVRFMPDGVVRDFITDGLIGGVGNVLVFLPQILLLFLFIGILEDSGYMARVAYLMDRIMRSVGLHGRAFVPMMSGFACAVPAILATRTMERQRDRLLTMMVVPLMTCSARLPVYALIIAALFPPKSMFGVPVQGLLMVGMYLFSTLTALAAAGVLGRSVVRGHHMPLILELPRYRVPKPSDVLRMMGQRSWTFVHEAGTVILACTIVMWALLSYPKPPGDTVAQNATAEPAAAAPASGETAGERAVSATATEGTVSVTAVDERAVGGTAADERAVGGTTADERAAGGTAVTKAAFGMTSGVPGAAKTAPHQPPADTGSDDAADSPVAPIAYSIGGRIGKALEPVVKPLGFDWQIAVGILGAFAAREVFVSTMGMVYGLGKDVDEETPSLRDRMRRARADGTPAYTPLAGLSLMVFFALACQCMSTLAVVRRETRSWRWPGFLFAYMTSLAYLTSLLIYQGGKLLGF